jgi:uncharacterized membrane protein YfcA
MVKLGGVVGALLGITILFVFTEWLYVDTFANHDLLETLMIVVAAIVGALAGARLVRRIASRNAKTS